MMVSKIKTAFDIRKQNKNRLFIVLVSFLISFAVARIYSLNFTHYVHIEGFHIHHFYFGTLSLVFGGILGILNGNKHPRRLKIASALIGIGIGLFADEIGLLLNCTTENRLCTYAFPDAGDIIFSIAIFITFLIAIADSNIEELARRYTKFKKVKP